MAHVAFVFVLIDLKIESVVCLVALPQARTVDPEVARLAQTWGEVEMLLRVRITCQSDCDVVAKDTSASLTYLDRLAATAARLGCTQGALSQALLPFDTCVHTHPLT